MHVPRFLLALPLIAAPSACTAAQSESPGVRSGPELESAEVDDPMASFARLVGGEWQYGTMAPHAWHWGPGRHSMRRTTHGSETAPGSWTGDVMYWHPALREVRTLSLHEDIPGVGRGVAEGTIRFEGETSIALVDLDQPRGRRKLSNRQSFEGRDKYDELLLEDTGAGFQPLAKWSFVRVEERPAAPSRRTEPASLELPESWKPFEALVGCTWSADRDSASGNAIRVESTVEWEPSLEVVFLRARTPNAKGEAEPWFDAYLFRDVRTEALRCLALTNRGGVCEGVVTALDGGALQFDLKVSEGDRVVPHLARFELQDDGRLRTRVWSLDRGDRTLTLDLLHERLATIPGR